MWRLSSRVSRVQVKRRAHGAAAFVGEFGHDPGTDTGRLFIETSLDAFDSHRMSWAIWVYEVEQGSWGLFDANGEARGEVGPWLADAVSRPYPQAVDGTLDGYRWEPEGRVYA